MFSSFPILHRQILLYIIVKTSHAYCKPLCLFFPDIAKTLFSEIWYRFLQNTTSWYSWRLYIYCDGCQSLTSVLTGRGLANHSNVSTLRKNKFSKWLKSTVSGSLGPASSRWAPIAANEGKVKSQRDEMCHLLSILMNGKFEKHWKIKLYQQFIFFLVFASNGIIWRVGINDRMLRPLGASAHLYDWHFSTSCEYFALPWLDLLPFSLPFSSNYETQNFSPKVQRVVNIFCFPRPALIEMQSHAQLFPWLDREVLQLELMHLYTIHREKPNLLQATSCLAKVLLLPLSVSLPLETLPPQNVN